MKEKTVDRRISRTRNLLFDAFLDLMIEKGYESITVQNIIDRANVGRSTFYLHFIDKEHLLTCSIGQLHVFLKEQSLARSLSEESSTYLFGFSMAMFQHAQSHKRLYKAIVGKKGGVSVMFHMQAMLNELISDEIAVHFPYSVIQLPRESVIDFVVNTYTIILAWWMEQNMPCSAEEANRIFHTMTLSGLNALK